MATVSIDCIGLRCPEPVLKVTTALMDLKTGDLLEVVADCPSFEQDIRKWADRLRKTILWVKREEGDQKRIQIQI